MASALIGGAISGIGGMFSANKQNKMAARNAANSRFQQFGLTGGGGTVSGEGTDMSVAMDPTTQMFQQMFSGHSANMLGGGAANQGGIDFANQVGNQMMPGIFGGAMDASMQTPGQSFADFGQFSRQNAMMGQGAGMQGLDLARQFGTSQTGINEGVAQGMFGQGFGALANTNQDALSEQFIARQRQLARPGDERAVNSKFANMFNKGALGFDSGQRQIGELALSQEQADIMRVNAGEQFGNMVGQQNRAFGMNAIGAGLGARAQDQQFNLGAANLFGNMGQNLLNFGQSSAQQALGADVGFSDMINSRGQQRLQNAQNMFGFGSQLQNQNFGQAMQGFGANSQINSDMRQLMALSGNLGSARSGANTNAGQIAMQGANSPFGSFLQGMGGGVASGSFGGFGGGGSAPATSVGTSGSMWGPNPFSNMFPEMG